MQESRGRRSETGSGLSKKVCERLRDSRYTCRRDQLSCEPGMVTLLYLGCVWYALRGRRSSAQRVQGDRSGCVKPPVDSKTKIVFYYVLLMLKRNF